ncbi:hypothetical protein [Vibrio aestuarianus]|uniref:hypothetical protein n=1 Tax=Vibrio aestuarianus TaxID=28171 RepID=UPI0014457F4F|nr:hypothetical protein [Vibrio aestuarianus]MDE1212676.1 hypothetical protein [Vibrio aestuarianus]MDE1215690.1 hypothetical protein [Vibrio aestuarianus]MDE1226984.1 hypothetical protein [Vibrio aestuarianus]MDE1259792.1 hypothetical protein [Vibrio aestuarianus]MDE1267945.1 hypothetical protein [Vibrio aestuarianus]
MSVKSKLLDILDKKNDADISLIRIMAHRHSSFNPNGLKGRHLRDAVAEYIDCYYEQMKRKEMETLLNYESPVIAVHGLKSKVTYWGK